MSTKNKHTQPNREPLLIDIQEASIILGVSTNSIRNYIRLGTLPSVRLGRRVMLPLRQLQVMTESKETR